MEMQEDFVMGLNSPFVAEDDSSTGQSPIVAEDDLRTSHSPVVAAEIVRADRDAEQIENKSSTQSPDLHTSRAQSEDLAPAPHRVHATKFESLLKGTVIDRDAIHKNQLAVVVPPLHHPWEYVIYEEPSVTEVLDVLEDLDGTTYSVQFSDGQEDTVRIPLRYSPRTRRHCSSLLNMTSSCKAHRRPPPHTSDVEHVLLTSFRSPSTT